MMMTYRPDYDDIVVDAREQGCRVSELLALSVGADPFYAGQPSRMRDGAWFADLWQRLGRPHGAHLRRLHYQLISQATPPTLPDGRPYENTEASWAFLNSASRNARYLGYISPTSLEDHRSAQPVLFATSRPTPAPEWAIDALDGYWNSPPALPSLDTAAFDWDINLTLPTPSIHGYGYDPADQPFHLEVWVEKSTVADVLSPICRRFGVDLVTGVGYLSITRVAEMLQRVAAHGKPARILYLSDFDPSGEGMPIQVARQSEFWLPDLAPDADLKLEPLVLTAEQVAAMPCHARRSSPATSRRTISRTATVRAPSSWTRSKRSTRASLPGCWRRPSRRTSTTT